MLELATENFSTQLGLFAVELESTMPGITDRLGMALAEFGRHAGIPAEMINMHDKLARGYAAAMPKGGN